MKAICILALAALTASLPAAAQFAKKDDAIDYRQSALSVMATHFGSLGAMAKGDVPYDAKAAQENADIVVFMSRLPWAGFGPGTEGGKAKPNVWTENAKFKELAGKMEGEAVKLAAAAKQGDVASLKAAFGATAGSCKACHDSFRNR
ncbi:cytochrome c [Acidovorax sp. CCYZU-2555]|uniref:c-type cytochrome n=1 Tax=Acidovorax sp. CCYZU-2555 TaxID=2835042 RepID=UPI001BCCB263|nr:cytochrome c [Acidovorax sp. CCYZU-2555]MBS7780390.1 cytochrome c [Acidovorax sp. CCYZU-2555]